MKLYIVLPELQRFYGRAIIIITPVEMPISDINRPLSIIIFVLYLSVYRVLLGLNLLWVLLTFIQWYPAIKPLQLWENYMKYGDNFFFRRTFDFSSLFGHPSLCPYGQSKNSHFCRNECRIPPCYCFLSNSVGSIVTGSLKCPHGF
jgi:hypothetical protein